jgi:hypothetical protein
MTMPFDRGPHGVRNDAPPADPCHYLHWFNELLSKKEQEIDPGPHETPEERGATVIRQVLDQVTEE